MSDERPELGVGREKLRAGPLVLLEGQPGAPEEGPKAFSKAVTWRSVLLGSILTPINCYWVIQMERVRYSAHPTTISILFNAVFGVLIVYMLNRLVARRRPSW
ncbi:MAG TPA: DUF6785 family protein, partial [Armatimonadota bacterium]